MARIGKIQVPKVTSSTTEQLQVSGTYCIFSTAIIGQAEVMTRIGKIQVPKATSSTTEQLQGYLSLAQQ